MQSADDVLDSFAGMITREQASAIANGGDLQSNSDRCISVEGALEFIKAVRGAKESADAAKIYTVNLEDIVYRIFNEVGDTSRRTVTLGREGSTINIAVSDRLSSAIDERGFERGDLVSVIGASLDILGERLVGTKSTTIVRMRRSRSGVTDFSTLKDGDRNIDIIGRVAELGQLRSVSRLGGGSVAAADCRISGREGSAEVTLWGSNALLTRNMHVGDFIKIEFCSVRSTEPKLQVNANELSRVLIHRDLSARFTG